MDSASSQPVAPESEKSFSPEVSREAPVSSEKPDVALDDAGDLKTGDTNETPLDVQGDLETESKSPGTSVETLEDTATEETELEPPHSMQEREGKESVQPTAEGTHGDGGIADQGYTLEDMQRLQDKFAEEAFNFLLRNAQIWTEYPKDFVARHDHTGCCMTFTHDVGKAIIMIAYIYRVEYRKRFRKIVHHVKTVEDYKKIVMSFSIHKDGAYFFHFLSWVAFAFDFTIYCLKAGRDFVDEGRRCLARYPDLEYFHSRGGWGELIEVSCIMADMYDDFSTVVSKELPSDDTLLPFMAVVEMIDRTERRAGNKWNLVTQEMRMLRQVRQKLLNKYEVVSSLDPRRVTRGFKVRMRKTPREEKPLEEVSKAAADLMKKYSVKKSSERSEIDSLVEKIERTRIAVELTDRLSNSEDEAKAPGKPPKEIGEEKSVFIVNERFLEKRSRKESPKKKRGLKVFSPTKQDLKLCIDLNEILDENIENKNYFKLKDGVYLVCPPGCDIKDDDARVIVLDTSSEEEEEEDTAEEIASSESVATAVMNMVKKSKMRQNKDIGETLKSPKKESEASSVAGSGQNEEQAKPPKQTGAIPKSKTLPKADGHGKLKSKDGDKEPDRNNEPSPKKKSPRKRKKSKK